VVDPSTCPLRMGMCLGRFNLVILEAELEIAQHGGLAAALPHQWDRVRLLADGPVKPLADKIRAIYTDGPASTRHPAQVERGPIRTRIC